MVTKLTSFGAFVEIAADLEGLLHISEMSDGKIDKPEEIVQPGQALELKVLNVDSNERKIGLSLKALDELGQPITAPATAEQETPKAEEKKEEAAVEAKAGEKTEASKEEKSEEPKEEKSE